MAIDFILFFFCFSFISSRKFTILLEDFAIIILKGQNNIRIVHSSENLALFPDSLCHKSTQNGLLVWVVHIPAFFVLVMNTFRLQKFITSLCLFWINIMTIKTDNHFNAVFIRKFLNSLIEFDLFFRVVVLNFQHKIFAEIFMESFHKIFNRIVFPERYTSRSNKNVIWIQLKNEFWV